MNRRRKPAVLKESFMFSRVFKKGRYANGYGYGSSGNSENFVTAYALKNYNRNAPSKLGISVSPKNGCAVKRNRAKRVIREAFASLYSRIPPGYIIVVIGRAPCFDKTNKMQRVLKSMESAMIKLDLIK